MDLALVRSRSRSISILDGASKFDFTVQNDGDQVTLKTKIVTAKITGTLIDEDPLAIYTIDKVLLPRELFKALAPSPSPAPAPEPAAADAPASPKKEGKKKKQKAADAPADEESAPADSPSDAADDSADDGNGAVRFDGVRSGTTRECGANT
ncbi:Fasciclin-like arabinogalactan protein [Arachis hypogaea]|nr:Fasciclin-like arabinogalactan protein [Arachis hypogaea]